jgi:hypothetical protein
MKDMESKQERKNVQLQETVDKIRLQKQKMKNDHSATLNGQDQKIKNTVEKRHVHSKEELSSAGSKCALYTKNLVKLEDSESRVSMLEQEVTQLRASKVRSEFDTKQLKTTMKFV